MLNDIPLVLYRRMEVISQSEMIEVLKPLFPHNEIVIARGHSSWIMCRISEGNYMPMVFVPDEELLKSADHFVGVVEGYRDKFEQVLGDRVRRMFVTIYWSG